MRKKSRQQNYKLRGAKDEMSLAIAFFQISHLLAAGVGIEHCLEEVTEQEDSWKLRRVWRDLAQHVKAGRSLSHAMSNWPGIFSSTLVAIIQSGEISGQMASSFAECRQMLLWRAGVSSRVQTVLIYPVLAFAVVLAVVIFLLIYLVPSLSGFVDESVRQLPWHTAALLFLSGWLQTNYQMGAFIVVLFTCGVYLAYRLLPVVRSRVDRQLLTLPYIGRLLLGISLSRYCENCAKLYERGIPLDSAMRVSERVVANQALRSALMGARLRVVSGGAFSNSMSCVPYLPNIFIRMVKAGDTSGNLRESLLQASLQQQQLTDTRIDRIEKLLGPVLLVAVGIILLWIIVSLLGPIYQSAIDAVIGL